MQTMRYGNINAEEMPIASEKAIVEANANPNAETLAWAATVILWWHYGYEAASAGKISRHVAKPDVSIKEMITYAQRAAVLGSREAVDLLADFHRSDQIGYLKNIAVANCWENAGLLNDSGLREEAKKCAVLPLQMK